MQAPTHLSHKPIIAVADYNDIDGIYSHQTDAQALSIGKAQWDETDLSLKVWRMVDGNWSRQSEELPVHRAFDLTILALSAFLNKPEIKLPNSVLGERIIALADLQMIRDYKETHRKLIAARLQEIQRLSTLFFKEFPLSEESTVVEQG